MINTTDSNPNNDSIREIIEPPNGSFSDPSEISSRRLYNKASLLVMNVDQYCLLSAIFKATLSVGAIKYYAVDTTKKIAAQLKMAEQRTPGGGLDLSMLNLADPSAVFKIKVA